ncbi:MAG: HlyC/CorC family transporter [Pseudomonadota bacterium]|nr:HlyC/CorC family transporter [Pseudomonadota bacterium]
MIISDLTLLVIILVILIIVSAYFSSSETAMMALNRYRLKHLAARKNRSAIQTQKLLEKPDRLIGLILLGNNFVNILAAQITTVIALTYFGENSLLASTIILTGVLLIFAEVIPKTIAATRPEKIALPSSWILNFLLKILYPAIWLVNQLANRIIKILGVKNLIRTSDTLSTSEIRTVVEEAGSRISEKYREMLFGILDLEKVTVEDIIIPRSEIFAVNLEDDWSNIVEQLKFCKYSRIPCYSGNINLIEGVLHMRKIRQFLLTNDAFVLKDLKALLTEPYFVPSNTSLYIQLTNFQIKKQRIAFAVDEYGELDGLITLQSLINQIFGSFADTTGIHNRDVFPQEDGSFLVDGSANLREINKQFEFNLPTDGPKTLNGLITEQMQDIPDVGTTFKLNGMTIEVVKTLQNAVKIAKLTKKSQKLSS